MESDVFDLISAEVRATAITRDVGRVVEVSHGLVSISGLVRVAALGDMVRWIGRDWTKCLGEIIRIGPDGVTALMAGSGEGISVGDRVQHLGACNIAPDANWVGRIVDPLGKPLDGKPLLRGSLNRPFQSPPPPAAQRRGLGTRLQAGLSVFNTLLPIVRGQRIGLFAGSGVGKSRLLGRLATELEADVVVVALVGERGRELREFAEKVLGSDGMKRSIIVAATSDQSPMERRRVMWSAMAISEHFRDQGQHVLLLADSVTRFAEAHREVALAAGETGSLRGYPPSVANQIMSLAERAGPGLPGTGDITAIFSVLVAGSNMEEPVSDILRGVLDGHIVLEREIAERGRFPAINILRSVSRSLPEAASTTENAIIARARQTLGTYDRVEMMVQSGLYVPGSDPEVDLAIRVWPRLEAFVAEAPAETIEESFARLADCLSDNQVNGATGDA